jgi:O-antigen/teichoic acid export membrane protein
MLMISGLDLTIVGMLDYSATAYYAIAATLTNFVAQAQNAIFSALLPASAVLAARQDDKKLGLMLLISTRYGMLTILGMSLPLMLAANYLLRMWVGAAYASHAVAIFEVLLVANVIRLCALPYATLLLGTGQQRKVLLSPIAEGVTNLATSVAGAYMFGAIGVAIGTLIGALVSVALHLLYNMPRTTRISIDRSLLIREGLIRPGLCALPLAVALGVRAAAPHFYGGMQGLWIVGAATTATLILFWEFGLLAPERQKLGEALRIS